MKGAAMIAQPLPAASRYPRGGASARGAGRFWGRQYQPQVLILELAFPVWVLAGKKKRGGVGLVLGSLDFLGIPVFRFVCRFSKWL